MPRADRDTRQAILEEALSLFCAKGYDGAGLRDLAERLDITSAALYYHFRGKADILCTLVEPVLQDLQVVINDPPKDRVELVGSVLDVLLEHRTVMSLIVRDRAVNLQPGVGDALAEHRERLVRLLAQGRSEDALVKATAAVGALLRPVVELPEVDLRRHRDRLVQAVSSVLAVN